MFTLKDEVTYFHNDTSISTTEEEATALGEKLVDFIEEYYFKYDMEAYINLKFVCQLENGWYMVIYNRDTEILTLFHDEVILGMKTDHYLPFTDNFHIIPAEYLNNLKY